MGTDYIITVEEKQVALETADKLISCVDEMPDLADKKAFDSLYSLVDKLLDTAHEENLKGLSNEELASINALNVTAYVMGEIRYEDN